MITAEFFIKEGVNSGFRICGHSGYAEEGNDIVCASVSSAVQLTANTITDFIGAEADVSVGKNGLITLKLKKDNCTASKILDSLRVHLEFISQEFSGTIKIKATEV